MVLSPRARRSKLPLESQSRKEGTYTDTWVPSGQQQQPKKEDKRLDLLASRECVRGFKWPAHKREEKNQVVES